MGRGQHFNMGMWGIEVTEAHRAVRANWPGLLRNTSSWMQRNILKEYFVHPERLPALRNIRQAEPDAILWASLGSCDNPEETWTSLKLLFGDPGVG